MGRWINPNPMDEEVERWTVLSVTQRDKRKSMAELGIVLIPVVLKLHR